MIFDEKELKKLVDEIRKEQQISPKIKDEVIINYIKEGMYDVNDYCGAMINYDENLKARSLLKNYVMYANYKRLAEFKELYSSRYDELQRDYYKPTNL